MGGDAMTTLRKEPELASADKKLLERYLTVPEAAQFLRISEATVRLHLTKKTLKRYKYGTRTLIRLRDAESLIREA
jgi:excisionase family DNA binding protein